MTEAPEAVDGSPLEVMVGRGGSGIEVAVTTLAERLAAGGSS